MPSPFFKCYPSDFLNGVADLSPNALAVYTICMMRMYDEDGSIPDNPVRIARRCNMRLPTCVKALSELEKGGKIERENGKIINPRVLAEIEKRREMRVKQSRNARGSDTGATRGRHGGDTTESHVEREGDEKRNKNKDTSQPTPSQRQAKPKPTRSQKPEARSYIDDQDARVREEIQAIKKSIMDEWQGKLGTERALIGWSGSLGIVDQWYADNCSVEDILPTIRAVMRNRGDQDPPVTLHYFTKPITEAREKPGGGRYIRLKDRKGPKYVRLKDRPVADTYVPLRDRPGMEWYAARVANNKQ